MKRIVVGVDHSAGAANALRWAARLAEVEGAEIVVMTSFVPTESELPPSRAAALLDEEKQRLDSWTAAVDIAEVAARTVVERGDPRPGILKVADREGADLIVVGRIGTSAGPGILHIGSMAEWLAHHSDVPIAVVGGAVNVTTRSVLVGLDGSKGSREAAKWVADLAAVGDVRVVAAAVHQPSVGAAAPEGNGDWRAVVERRIREDLASDFTTAEVAYSPLALRGANVADTLLEAAKDERTDVIVVGARGLGGFSGLRVGGVALKTLHRADRPVVIVPSD